jgi:CubicO group peptidase (beta-lactamase class C family)
MAHLMTHTPGFEDNVIGLFARSEKQMIPLGQLLARDLPARVRPPGQFAAYSNHGSALAGYIGEELRYGGYAEERTFRIYRPL